jgi:hypothetical protein
MKSTNVKAMVAKVMAVGFLASAFVLASPTKAEAQGWQVGVQFGGPVYYGDDGRRAYWDHERQEEFERQQAYQQHEAWEEHERQEAFERQRAYGYGGYGYGGGDNQYYGDHRGYWGHRRGDDDDDR